MGRVDNKVAFITGAARGMGRSHAIRLAEEGADIIAVDLCEHIETVEYPLSTDADLEQTVKEVEALGRRCLTVKADVRDLAALTEAAEQGVAELGPIDIVIANAGIATAGTVLGLDEETWQTTLDINLTAVWKTVKATVPAMVERGQGGSVILISSGAGLAALPNAAHYNSAKHGVVGLMKSLAVELAPHNIRANSIHPATVDTPMVANEATYRVFTGGAFEHPTREQAAAAMRGLHALDLPWTEPRDISNAVLYLASDEARYTTGTTMVVDGGSLLPFKIPHAP